MKARVLVAEDEKVNQLVIARLLATIGAIADVASNGREALAAAHHTAYDLILMDCHMPELDGFDATRAVRDFHDGATSARVPIVALTANATDAERERSRGAGMNDHLTKPVTRAELEKTIERWVALNGAPSAH